MRSNSSNCSEARSDQDDMYERCCLFLKLQLWYCSSTSVLEAARRWSENKVGCATLERNGPRISRSKR